MPVIVSSQGRNIEHVTAVKWHIDSSRTLHILGADKADTPVDTGAGPLVKRHAGDLPSNSSAVASYIASAWDHVVYIEPSGEEPMPSPWKFNINTRASGLKTCQVWYGDELRFSGVDLSLVVGLEGCG